MPALPRSLRAAFLASLAVSCGGAHAPPPGAPSSAAPAPQRVAAAAPASSAPSPSGTVQSPAPSTEAADRVPDPAVRVSFEPLVTAVPRGGRFYLALRFRITPGYWISWKTPGEVGQKTVVTFRAPPGFSVGPVQFPAPSRYQGQAGYVGFGYQNETAIFAEIKAPARLSSKEVYRFDVEANWVACKARCATERSAAFVELDATSGSAKAKETQASLAPFFAQLPQPLSRLRKSKQSWEGLDAPEGQPQLAPTLLVKLPGFTARDFFPEPGAAPAPTKTTLGDGEIRFAYEHAPGPGSQPLRGVIVGSVAGKDRAFDFEAKIPDDKDAKRRR